VLSEAARSLWAKSDRGRSDGRWLPLIAHLLDVAAAAEAIVEREKLAERYAEDLGLTAEAAVPWLAALVGLHDIGKAFPGFQLQWKRQGRELGRELLERAGYPLLRSITDGKQPAHGVVSHYLLTNLLQRHGLTRRAARDIADALGAHHGFRARHEQVSQVRHKLGSGLWDEVRTYLCEQVFETVGAVNCPAPTIAKLSGQAFMRLAGLASVADWIGSSVKFFPFERSLDDLTAYYHDARKHAQGALELLRWPRLESKLPEFDALFGFPPRSLQSKTIGLLQHPGGPTLFLVEAPMGEGKTEAALYAHLMLQQNLGHRGFYLALPTQATGNAMFDRIVKFLAKLGLSEPPDLQLIHGAALLDERFEAMKLEVGEPRDPEQRVVAREWFTHKKQALLSPHGVGTVDQGLLSVLNVGHQFVRLWGLANRTVIIDEVHAYELYTSTLIERLVVWLKALGSSVILLSATLPQEVRTRLIAAYGGTLPADDQAYPRITRVSNQGTKVEALEARTLSYEVHEAPLHIEPLATLLRELSEGGGAVGCIVNTVDRAQKLYTALQELPGEAEVRLFHARYPAKQRKDIETWVVGTLGKKTLEPRNLILIATQVVEQSLDVDFDVLVSDLAPIDLLIQRAGRLHRHDDPTTFKRPRPSKHKWARFYVAGLGREADLPDITSYFWHKVYAPAVLLRSWVALRKHEHLTLPDDLEPLLELVYGNATLPGVSETFLQALQPATAKLEEEKAEHERLARQRALAIPEVFLEVPIEDMRYSDDDDPEVNRHLRAATRLGEPSLTVVLLHEQDGQLSLTADGRTPVYFETEPSFEETKLLLQYAVSLSNKTVFHALADPTPEHFPNAWRENALLRHVRVLKLKDGRCPIGGKLVVKLDDALGIVYEGHNPEQRRS
jgi:CRISPR-associated endonuclease/helicase Cas3